jgi:hypothetical protein
MQQTLSLAKKKVDQILASNPANFKTSDELIAWIFKQPDFISRALIPERPIMVQSSSTLAKVTLLRIFR